jgi:hypothetical protein
MLIASNRSTLLESFTKQIEQIEAKAKDLERV